MAKNVLWFSYKSERVSPVGYTFAQLFAVMGNYLSNYNPKKSPCYPDKM